MNVKITILIEPSSWIQFPALISRIVKSLEGLLATAGCKILDVKAEEVEK